MEKTWITKDKNIFLIGGRQFKIGKTGRQQAEQIEKLNAWLKEHIAPMADSLRGQDVNEQSSGWALFEGIMGGLTADAQMELAKALLGNSDIEGKPVDDQFFDEYYDINWVVDALSIASQTGASQRLITAFFTSAG